jgi:hypothetical protein
MPAQWPNLLGSQSTPPPPQLAARPLPQVLQVLDPQPSGGGAAGGDGRDDSPAPSFGSLVYGEPLRVRLVQLATLVLQVGLEG